MYVDIMLIAMGEVYQPIVAARHPDTPLEMNHIKCVPAGCNNAKQATRATKIESLFIFAIFSNVNTIERWQERVGRA